MLWFLISTFEAVGNVCIWRFSAVVPDAFDVWYALGNGQSGGR
jgi:hypothetical protein